MKKNNIKKVILAAALVASVFGPKVEKAYATNTITVSQEFYDAYIGLKNTIKQAKEMKETYKYVNALDFYQRALDRQIKASEEVFDKAYTNIKLDRNLANEATRLDLVNSTRDLKLAMNALDGKKASISELKELLDDNRAFTESSSFIYATKAEKDAYVKAYEEANSFVTYHGYDESKLSESKVAAYVKNLKDARLAITKSYEPLENKGLLKEEIAISAKLRNDASKYTKKSFESFLSALSLAETSVEDKASKKTAVEYKELTKALRTARLALVENKVEDESTKLRRQRLQKSLEENRIAVKAAKLLLDVSPEKVKSVKADLLKLIKNSEALAVKAEEALKKLDGIKG